MMKVMIFRFPAEIHEKVVLQAIAVVEVEAVSTSVVEEFRSIRSHIDFRLNFQK